MTLETVRLDIRGQICPSCLLLTLREVNRHAAAIRAGKVEVEVFTDDRQATATIPESVTRMGFRVEVGRDPERAGGYRIHIHAA